jgi:hypothetical protein
MAYSGRHVGNPSDHTVAPPKMATATEATPSYDVPTYLLDRANIQDTMLKQVRTHRPLSSPNASGVSACLFGPLSHMPNPLLQSP